MDYSSEWQVPEGKVGADLDRDMSVDDEEVDVEANLYGDAYMDDEVKRRAVDKEVSICVELSLNQPCREPGVKA
ncbi:hypothetical protein FoTM2_014379 [Fusarium oxysporum f. sp. vasinfectum]|nr:hypothetical protein FoTM2_014379 [Fusarium oxysporum f. sp. vasinfectum]